MAHLNITIPDPLYERLKQVGDRMNFSRVCARALEKELAELEHPGVVDNPKVAKLLARLQSVKERWYQRGRDDGLQWAVENATRDELHTVATQMAEWSGERLLRAARPDEGRNGFFAASIAASLAGSAGFQPVRIPTSFLFDEQLERWIKSSGEAEVDEASYFQGWRDAVKEIWEVVYPSLQS